MHTFVDIIKKSSDLKLLSGETAKGVLVCEWDREGDEATKMSLSSTYINVFKFNGHLKQGCNERKWKKTTTKKCIHDEKCLITNWSHRMILHVYAHIFLNGFLFAQHTNEMIYCLLVKYILSRVERGHQTLLLMPLLYFSFEMIQYHITWLSYVWNKNASLFRSLFIFPNRMNDSDKTQHFPFKLNLHVTL